MTIAQGNRIARLEARVDALEQALQILLHSEHAAKSARVDPEWIPALESVRSELRGLKISVGHMRAKQ